VGLTVALFFVISAVAFAGDNAGESNAVQDIRTKCAAIDGGKGYKKVQIDVLDRSANGGVAVGYFEKKKLMKIVENSFGESGNMTGEYYFDDDKLIFVFIQGRRYKHPETAEEDFGPVHCVEEDRFYFRNNKLIRKLTRWRDSSGNIMPSGYPDYFTPETSEIDLMKDVGELENRIKRQATQA